MHNVKFAQVFAAEFKQVMLNIQNENIVAAALARETERETLRMLKARLDKQQAKREAKRTGVGVWRIKDGNLELVDNLHHLSHRDGFKG